MSARHCGLIIGAVVAALGAAGAEPRQTAPPLSVIAGTVVDAADGRPIGGAIVSISGPPPAPVPAGSRRPPLTPPARILTGTDGRFVFGALPAGTYSLNAVRLGYAPGASGRRRPEGPSQPIVLAAGHGVGDVLLKMWKHGTITGTVVDEAGEPLVGVEIHAWRRALFRGRPYLRRAATTLTDDRGMYRIGRLLAGEYVVGAAWTQASVPPGTMGSATREMPLPRSSSGVPTALRVGNVIYYGRGAPVPPPPVGERLSVYPTTFHPSVTEVANAAAIALGSGEERGAVDLVLQPVRAVRVSGVLVGPEGPSAGTVIRAVPAAAEGISLESDIPVAATDANGSFVFPAVPAGSYSIRTAIAPRAPTPASAATPDRALWANLPLNVGEADIDGLVLTLQNGLRISGRVEFDGTLERPAGERLASVPIAIEPAGMIPIVQVPRPPARIDAKRRFTSVGLGPGEYFVRILGSPPGWMFRSAMHEGRDLSQVPIEISTSDVTGVVITFTDRWSGLSGKVHGLDGSADEGALVVVFPTDAQEWKNVGPNPRRMRSTRTRGGGEYSVTSLPPGNYYVAAISDEQAVDWLDSRFLEAAARIAVQIAIGEGEHKVQELRTREIRAWR